MVVGVEQENELHQRIHEVSGAEPGTELYFSFYQRELSKLWNKMSEKDQQRAGSIADRWNKIGPPPEQQLK